MYSLNSSFILGQNNSPYVSVLDRKSLDAGFVRFSSRHYDFLVGRAIVVEPLSEWHEIEMCFLFLLAFEQPCIRFLAFMMTIAIMNNGGKRTSIGSAIHFGP